MAGNEEDLLDSIDVESLGAPPSEEAALDAIDVNSLEADEAALDSIDVKDVGEKSWTDSIPSLKEYADYYSAPFKALKNEGVSGFIDKSLDIGKGALSSAFTAIEPVLDASDRLAGTTVAYTIDGYQGLLGYDGKTSPIEKAKLRDIKMGYNIVDEVARPRTLPVSLSQDLLQNPTTEFMMESGDKLKQSGYEKTGDVVQGLAASTGIAAALVGSFVADPISMIKMGKLTQVGEDLAKAEKLAKGTTRQIVQGERNMLGVEFMGSYKNVLPKKLENKVILEAQEFLADMEMSAPGQWLRQYTTKGSLVGVGRAAEDFVLTKSIIDGEKKKLYQVFTSKAQSTGLDIADSTIRSDLYKYMDNPSTYTPKFGSPEQYESIYKAMDTELQAAVNSARAAGVNIAEFKPSMLIDDTITTSERYIPRYGTPTSRQKLVVSKMVKDQEEADAIVETLGLATKGSKKTVSNAALIERSKLNRDQMNAVMKEQFGVDEFFHDDVFAAYADKIAEVKTLEESHKLRSAVLESAGKTQPEWAAVKSRAVERVKQARAAGLVPDPDDLRLAKIKMNTLTSIDPMAARQLGKSVKDTTQLYLPKPDADLINGIFVNQSAGNVRGFANGVMRAWKNSVFFNPGFHGRNIYENYTRAMGVGLSKSQLVKAQAEFLFNKGNLKYVDEFKTMEGPVGMLTEVAGTQGAKTIKATKEMVEGENALNRMLRSLHEASAKGTVGKLLEGLRKAPDKYADNPLFKFSSSVNSKGESAFRYAYYKKLREQGYTQKAAMKEVNSKFISYQITRNKVVSGQLVAPFLNYMVKNAETSMKILAQNPKSLVMYGPGGALQRAIENWSGWEPGQPYRLKQIFPAYYSDQFMGHILPNEDKMMKEKDYIKQLMNSWMNSDGKLTGYGLWAKLPSNYHGLLAMNPLKADDLAGPMVKMGVALLGIDPFTGAPITGANQKDVGATERIMRAWDEGAAGFRFDRAMNASRQYVQDKWPEYESKLTNLGFSPEVMKVMMGDQSESQQRKMRKALSSIKTLMMGQATQLDVDVYFRVMADLKDTKTTMAQLMNKAGKTLDDKTLDQSIERTVRVYDQLIKRIDNIFQLKEEYDRAVVKAGGTPMDNVEITETLTEKPEDEDLGIESEDNEEINLEEEELDADEAMLDSVDPTGVDRMPAQLMGIEMSPEQELKMQKAADEYAKRYLHMGVDQRGDVKMMTGGNDNPGLAGIYQDWLYQGEKPKGVPTQKGREDLYKMLQEEFQKNNEILPYYQDPSMFQQKLSQSSQEDGRSPAQARMPKDTAPVTGKIPDGAAAGAIGAAAMALGGAQDTEATLGSRATKTQRDYRRMSDMELAALPDSFEKSNELYYRGYKDEGKKLGITKDYLVKVNRTDSTGDWKSDTMMYPAYGKTQLPDSMTRQLPGNYELSIHSEDDSYETDHDRFGAGTKAWVRGFAINPDTLFIGEVQANNKDKNNRNKNQKDVLLEAVKYAENNGFTKVAIASPETVKSVRHFSKEDKQKWVDSLYGENFPNILRKELGEGRDVEAGPEIDYWDLTRSYNEAQELSRDRWKGDTSVAGRQKRNEEWLKIMEEERELSKKTKSLLRNKTTYKVYDLVKKNNDRKPQSLAEETGEKPTYEEPGPPAKDYSKFPDYDLFEGVPEMKEFWDSLPDDKKPEALKLWLDHLRDKKRKKK